MFQKMYEEYARELFVVANQNFCDKYVEDEMCRIQSFEAQGMLERVVTDKGFMVIGKGNNCHPLCNYYIEALYIRKEFRRKGIGQEMVRSYLKGHPGRYVLFILNENKEALKFWSKIGILAKCDDMYNNDADSTQYFFEIAQEEGNI